MCAGLSLGRPATGRIDQPNPTACQTHLFPPSCTRIPHHFSSQFIIDPDFFYFSSSSLFLSLDAIRAFTHTHTQTLTYKGSLKLRIYFSILHFQFFRVFHALLHASLFFCLVLLLLLLLLLLPVCINKSSSRYCKKRNSSNNFPPGCCSASMDVGVYERVIESAQRRGDRKRNESCSTRSTVQGFINNSIKKRWGIFFFGI